MADKPRQEQRDPKSSDKRPNETPTSASNENQRSQAPSPTTKASDTQKQRDIQEVKKSYEPLTKK